MLYGAEGVAALACRRVALFGVGGVGGYVAEVLARSGVGHILLVDADRVDESNINRQLVALSSTVGQYKVDVAERRIRDINPACEVSVRRMFYLPENAGELDLSAYDCVADCIDTVAAKVELAVRCQRLGVHLVSCMGAGRRQDPTRFRVDDVYRTHTDPLSRAMRGRLRVAGVERLRVVYSEEPPMETAAPASRTPGSNAWGPAAAGIVLGGDVVRYLLSMGR